MWRGAATRSTAPVCFRMTPFHDQSSSGVLQATSCHCPTMRIVKVRDLVRLVEADGWKHVRTTGSHRHFKHSSKPNVVTIPGHPGDDVPVGTLKSVLKAAGLENRA
jgi:predicted RNA binding protein YcfA (HicA-like mRNA interferase family)